jgi:AraC family transcriptional regulator
MQGIIMTETARPSIQPARFETAAAMLIAGLRQHYSPVTAASIPQLWERLVPYMDKVAHRVGDADYGVCFDADSGGNFSYLCGFEVTELSSLPAEFNHIRIPPQRYAVFAHDSHVSQIPATMDAIYRSWLPTATGTVPAGTPDFFERYGPRFDPQAGRGDVQIWLPIKSSAT